MKKFLTLVPLIALLAACGTTSDPYERRANAERERQEKYVQRTIDQAPSWMIKTPISNSAVYASGTSASGDYNMAFHKDAIGLAIRPLPVDGDGMGVKQGVYNDPVSGLSIRLTMGYDNSLGGMTVRAEALYGVKIMRQGLAVALKEA